MGGCVASRVFVAALLFAACHAEVKPDAAAPEVTDQELSVEQGFTTFKVKLSGKLKCSDTCSATGAKFELVVDGKVVHSGEQPVSLNLSAGTGGDLTLEQGSQYVANAEELKAMDTRGGSLLVALRGKLHVTQGAKTF